MYKKKSLGQHFLHNAHYLGKVADSLHIKPGETVVEVGPGDGALTEVLLARGAKVIALEKDTRLISVLKEKFAEKDFKVIEGDALEFDTSKLKKYKVAGNIPYYISGALFKKFLTEKNQPSTLVFLIQKEVAQRIAREKKESILSLSVKAYGKPKYVATVPRGAFSPPPKVDSAILSVSDISRHNFKNAAHEKRFFEFVKLGFGQKRKLLASNLKKILGERSFALGKIRAEDVPLEEWLTLSWPQ
jgi:16S rRNA (adenine1518-N6/adenine1519-N6)-dimethyltransferase